ncbi:unnamed protein product [Oncorhynchus mykiss]|uniref:SPRY domain-containing protein n=1 Tax=Oncorhynchus mykiss TaxID=8022 RepID=A0A060YRK1_ONCMY|nr:unnamed protein product [Oncorhynchus mykiss]
MCAHTINHYQEGVIRYTHTSYESNETSLTYYHLISQGYPKNRHPGWSRGSIAYHADDGKLFQGSGVGDAFGPRCFEGDVMGCGIMFPRDYILDSGGECTIRLLPSETDNHETNNVIRL